MFERLKKPFLTVDTGEAYQPIRLAYRINNKKQLIEKLNHLNCLEKRTQGSAWDWYWNHECETIRFDSLDTYKKNSQHPTRLGSFIIKDENLFLNLPCFKRACLALPFFHVIFNEDTTLQQADFINKIFSIDERSPHGFTELFKEHELETILKQRVSDYKKILTRCEEADSAEDALSMLANYADTEAQKRLPYAERYEFQLNTQEDNPDVLFLGFYIFLRSRELVAVRRWHGDAHYNLAAAAEELTSSVFGGMDIDLID